MTATRLLILGAVRERGQAHGYQIRRDLESWYANLWGSVRQGSIYHGLRKLSQERRLTEVPTTQASGGPARTEYTVTATGEQTFVHLLEAALSSEESDIAMTIAGIGFMTELPRSRVVDLLRARVEAYATWRARVVGEFERNTDQDWQHHAEAVGLWANTADSAIAWTEDLIRRLENGAYVMAGEDR